jgi:hypothetical protein
MVDISIKNISIINSIISIYQDIHRKFINHLSSMSLLIHQFTLISDIRDYQHLGEMIQYLMYFFSLTKILNSHSNLDRQFIFLFESHKTQMILTSLRVCLVREF